MILIHILLLVHIASISLAPVTTYSSILSHFLSLMPTVIITTTFSNNFPLFLCHYYNSSVIYTIIFESENMLYAPFGKILLLRTSFSFSFCIDNFHISRNCSFPFLAESRRQGGHKAQSRKSMYTQQEPAINSSSLSYSPSLGHSCLGYVAIWVSSTQASQSSSLCTRTHTNVYACVSVCLYLKMYYKCVNETTTTTTIQFSTSIFRPIFALVNGFALSLLLATPVCSYLTKFCISFSIFNAANRLHMHTHTYLYIHT